MRSLDQIYGSDDVLYVMNDSDQWVSPQWTVCRMIAGTYRYGGREYSDFLVTVRDLMLAGF